MANSKGYGDLLITVLGNGICPRKNPGWYVSTYLQN
jgi:hypothetical protein